jgi:hypothetical protein
VKEEGNDDDEDD